MLTQAMAWNAEKLRFTGSDYVVHGAPNMLGAPASKLALPSCLSMNQVLPPPGRWLLPQLRPNQAWRFFCCSEKDYFSSGQESLLEVSADLSFSNNDIQSKPSASTSNVTDGLAVLVPFPVSCDYIHNQQPQSDLEIVSDMQVPEHLNTRKSRFAGKRIYFRGNWYDARDPHFIKLRNENMMEVCQRLHDKFEYSNGFSLSDEWSRMRGQPIPEDELSSSVDHAEGSLANAQAFGAAASGQQIIFTTDNDFWRPYDFENNVDLQKKLGSDFPTGVFYMERDEFFMPWDEIVAVDTSLLLRLVDLSPLQSKVERFFQHAQCSFAVCESVPLECVNAMRSSRVQLKNAKRSRWFRRTNHVTGKIESGMGWTKDEYEHNTDLIQDNYEDLREFTAGWWYAHSEGTSQGGDSIVDLHFRENCQLFDGRIVHEAWQYADVLFSRDHHKVVLKGKRDGKERTMICVNPLLMTVNFIMS